MAICGEIVGSFGFNCPTPLQSGTRDRAYIINFDDWENAALDPNLTNDMVIEGITFAVTSPVTTAFYVDGNNNSHNPSFALVPQSFGDVYDHLFDFLVFDLSNAAKLKLDNMVGGRYVVIYENSFKGASGQSAFEILGGDAGMRITAFTRSPLNNDNQGAYVLTMSTPEQGKEPHMPRSFFLTDYATTKAALEALL